jgi:hypothetical protein
MLHFIITFCSVVLCITVILSIIVKIRCWKKAGKTRFSGFIFSFFKWYNVYKVQSTTSRRRQQFMLDNNRINLTLWGIISITVLCMWLTILELK